MSKRREKVKLARRRAASTPGAHRRPPVKPGRLSPDRSVPASIPRPPYAPDAPALVPAFPPAERAERMRAAGHAAREILLELRDAVRVGMTTDELDRICHGIPDSRELLDGDIVNCDVTIYLNGVHGDTNATFCVGDVDDEGRRLVQVTQESLWKGIDEVRPGAKLNEIGRAIQLHAEAA